MHRNYKCRKCSSKSFNLHNTSITTRQLKRAAKRKPVHKVIYRINRTRRSAIIAADDLDGEVFLLPVGENSSSDEDLVLEEDNQSDSKTTTASYFLTSPNFEETWAPKVLLTFTTSSFPKNTFKVFEFF